MREQTRRLAGRPGTRIEETGAARARPDAARREGLHRERSAIRHPGPDRPAQSTL